jgi:DHA1 family multidrug resistance protein-like MFS transporter
MTDLIRDAPFGQLIRFLTGNRFFQYPEEKPRFALPAWYYPENFEQVTTAAEHGTQTPVTRPQEPKKEDEPYPRDGSEKTSKEESEDNVSQSSESDEVKRIKTVQSHQSQRSHMVEPISMTDVERQRSNATIERVPSRPVIPERLADGTILVSFYTTDDPANPQTWGATKKAIVIAQVVMYTFFVYMGSSIYSSSIPGVIEKWGVSTSVASLGLSMYVLGYGVGPLLFSPLTEIPIVGRNPPYIITYTIYVILLVPSVLTDSFPGFIVLRFLLGFFGSPCLATAGASMTDVSNSKTLPYILAFWAYTATCAPALGPLISGFSVQAMGWRWSVWEMLWMNGPMFFIHFFFLPETSTANILLRRAQRLRKVTGNPKIRSQSELDQAHLSARDITIEALWRPFQLVLLDPAIAFTAVYIALVYGIYYSFFECFPLVYTEMYGFNLGELGLTFLSVSVAVTIAIVGYYWYIYTTFTKPESSPSDTEKGDDAAEAPPERRLIPAMAVTFLIPVGLFVFAWTANSKIHWIASMIGIVIATIGIFLIVQCIFLYLPLVYPQYAASLFAGNAFMRCSLAAGAIHFSIPMFHNLGVSRGVSLLAGLTVGCSVGVFLLYFFGADLRGKSRFSKK